MKRVIRDFAEDLLDLCVLNRERVTAFHIVAPRSPENSVASRKNSSTSEGPQQSQKRRAIETDETKATPPRPAKKQRRTSNDTEKTKKSTKSKKTLPKSGDPKAIVVEQSEAENAKKESWILTNGTERQKSKLKEEKGKKLKDDEERWLERSITKMLKQEGWDWIGASSNLDTWYFACPGCKAAEEGVLGKDYFRHAKEIKLSSISRKPTNVPSTSTNYVKEKKPRKRLRRERL